MGLLRKNNVEISFMDFSWTKYKAVCWLNYLWNKDGIDKMVKEMGYVEK